MRPTHIGKQIWFLQPTNSNANLFEKHHHRHTQKSCFSSYLGILEPSQVDIWNKPSQGQTDLFVFPCAPWPQPRESGVLPLPSVHRLPLPWYPWSHTWDSNRAPLLVSLTTPPPPAVTSTPSPWPSQELRLRLHLRSNKPDPPFSQWCGIVANRIFK